MSVRPATTASNNTRLDAANGAETVGRSSFHNVTPKSAPFPSPAGAAGVYSRLSRSRANSNARRRSTTAVQRRERFLTLVVVATMLLYVVFLGVMFYLNSLKPIMGLTAERNASGQWVVSNINP